MGDAVPAAGSVWCCPVGSAGGDQMKPLWAHPLGGGGRRGRAGEGVLPESLSCLVSPEGAASPWLRRTGGLRVARNEEVGWGALEG